MILQTGPSSQIYTALLGMIRMEYMIQLTALHNLFYTVLKGMMNMKGNWSQN